MHSVLRDQLRDLYNGAKPLARRFEAPAFLRGLGPIHLNWHTQSRRLGFLTFHWFVVDYFRRVGGPGFLGGVPPYTTRELGRLGATYDADVPVPSGGLDELRQFSGSIEGWHNNAHMAISMEDGVDLMNALTNIWLRQFWRLHFFINREFEKKLKAYGRGVVTGPRPSAVIAYLENNFHWAVREI